MGVVIHTTLQVMAALLGSGLIAAVLKALLDWRLARAEADDARRGAAHVIRTNGFPDGYTPPSAALESPKLPVVEPLNEEDAFCSCPACGLLGSHGLSVESFDMAHLQCVNRLMMIRSEAAEIADRETPTAADDARFRALRDEFDKVDADRRALEGLTSSARRRTTHARRECVFCEYVWHTDAVQTVS